MGQQRERAGHRPNDKRPANPRPSQNQHQEQGLHECRREQHDTAFGQALQIQAVGVRAHVGKPHARQLELVVTGADPDDWRRPPKGDCRVPKLGPVGEVIGDLRRLVDREVTFREPAAKGQRLEGGLGVRARDRLLEDFLYRIVERERRQLRDVRRVTRHVRPGRRPGVRDRDLVADERRDEVFVRVGRWKGQGEDGDGDEAQEVRVHGAR